MSCPNNLFGQPICNIVPHPDRPEIESFCVTCQKRFRNETYPGQGAASFLMAVILTILIFVVL